MIRIEGFSSFVASRNEFNSNRISVGGKDKCEWDISLQFCRYNRIRKEFFCVISSSPEPETLGAFVCGTRSDQKECSFDVDAIFRFKRPSTAPDCRYSHKFDFNSENRHYDSWGYWDLARIDVSDINFWHQLFRQLILGDIKRAESLFGWRFTWTTRRRNNFRMWINSAHNLSPNESFWIDR